MQKRNNLFLVKNDNKNKNQENYNYLKIHQDRKDKKGKK